MCESSGNISSQDKVLLLEKKKLRYQRFQEQERPFEAEMKFLDLQQQQREGQELAAMDSQYPMKNLSQGVAHYEMVVN